jgi:hypothetical protein
LAPPAADTSAFQNVEVRSSEREALIKKAQRLRADVYLEINALDRSQLTSDGRHIQQVDDWAWHLLTVGEDDRVWACARCALHESTPSYSALGVSKSALAQSQTWGRRLQKAVESELAAAQLRQLRYAEVGGWAIAPALRCSTEALRMMLAFYALSEWFGGALGLTTAKLSCSAPLLQRIGGRPLLENGLELPAYYDPEYRCDLQVLRFDSSCPNPKYESYLSSTRASLATVPVIRNIAARSRLPFFPHANDVPGFVVQH